MRDYWTMSHVAASVMAGIPPAYLLAVGPTYKYIASIRMNKKLVTPWAIEVNRKEVRLRMFEEWRTRLSDPHTVAQVPRNLGQNLKKSSNSIINVYWHQ